MRNLKQNNEFKTTFEKKWLMIFTKIRNSTFFLYRSKKIGGILSSDIAMSNFSVWREKKLSEFFSLISHSLLNLLKGFYFEILIGNVSKRVNRIERRYKFVYEDRLTFLPDEKRFKEPEPIHFSHIPMTFSFIY